MFPKQHPPKKVGVWGHTSPLKPKTPPCQVTTSDLGTGVIESWLNLLSLGPNATCHLIPCGGLEAFTEF